MSGPATELFVASFVALFFESLLVRWLPTSLYYLGYFKNCILIATFLGFGVGCATRVRLERVLPGFSLLTAAAVLVVSFAESSLAVKPFETGEFLWPQTSQAGIPVSLHVFLAVTFLGAALLMLPLGRLVGAALQRLPPLFAYSLNLFASLLGATTFIACSLLELGPTAWFAIALLPLAFLLRADRRALALSLLGTSLTLGVLAAFSQPRDEWSPYSKITLLPTIRSIDARVLLTNNSGHQVLYDLSAGNLSRRPALAAPEWSLVDDHRTIYESAYALRPARRVLIVGGGTGNEAAAALRRGAERVDVVEIDPVILRIGRERHPERPYSDPRVRTFVDDGRHYVATSDQTYDLIVFGFLDSTSRLAGLSNIRLDNYIYTIEALREARRRLAPDGLLQITYYASQPFIAARLQAMLAAALGQPPLAYQLAHGRSLDLILFSGPALLHLPAEPRLEGLVRRTPQPGPASTNLPTDDWPFMAVERRGLGSDYVTAIAIMLGCSGLLVVSFVRGEAKDAGDGATRAWVFFLQGAAFMLLEALTIMRMALLLGSTWIVVSLTIVTVLASGLLSVWLVQRARAIGVSHALALLGLGVVACFWLATTGAGRTSGVPTAVSAAALFTPILGSSLLFSRLFEGSVQSARELGFNLLGAVTGGLTEYASLVVGVGRVYLIVLGLTLLMTVLLRLAPPFRSPASLP